VGDAVRDVAGLAASLKWPNDVLLDGRKVAGILTEMEAEIERVRFVIAGIGVNVNAIEFPPELASKATSLRLAAGRPGDRPAFTGGVLAPPQGRPRRVPAARLAAVRWEGAACSGPNGQELPVTSAAGGAGDGWLAGQMVGVDDDGALRLAGPHGELRVVAGEVTLPGAYDG